MHRDRRLLDSANGKPCAGCGRNDGTVVAAHSNDLAHGKGVGHRAHDIFHARLCHACHDFVDGRRKDEPTGLYPATRDGRRECWRRAFDRTILALAMEGRIGST
ncbi:MAG: DUF1364 family protein [Betaproteobacteria bacterium]|nr:DUF1364 family protein [Betaproteobacteria bacterium]